jgi:hypothetical protein
MRAAQSKGKADLIALWPATAHDGWPGPNGCPPVYRPRVWIVQCKTGSARMSKAEKQEFADLADATGTVAMLAEPGPNNRGVVFTPLQGGSQ